MSIQLISLDIFDTLADYHPRIPVMWERLMGRPVSETEGQKLWESFHRGYWPHYRDLRNPPFRTMGSAFEIGFTCLRDELVPDLDPKRAAEVFLEEHDAGPIYEDVPEALRRLAEVWPLVISSDADRAMVKTLAGKFPCEKVFLSENLRCYKDDRDGRFFDRVIRETGYAPEEILHVGDGLSDIRGGKRSGLKVCRILREGPMTVDFPADYTVCSMKELADLLLSGKTE